MAKLDLKDRKILYELDLDCRQSNAQIGKKVGLGRDVVAYRINKLEEEGVIKFYWTNIDAYKLGYHVFRFYINYQYVTPEIKEKIINFLVSDKRTWVVNSIVGKYDLAVVVWVKNIHDFYNFWEKLLNKYGDYFSNKIFSIYVQAFSYPKSYLLLENYNESDRLDHEIVGVGESVKLDKMDMDILNIISDNARIPLIDIASKLKTSSQTINYRIQNLTKQGVIQGFRVAVDISKLDIQYYKVDIYLKEHSVRNKIIDFIKTNSSVGFIATSAGVSDLEIEFFIKDTVELNEEMNLINNKFPGTIKNWEYFTVSKNHKLKCIPES